MAVRDIAEIAAQAGETDGRISRALGLVETGAIGPREVVVLVRQLLVGQGYAPALVPTGGHWPKPAHWEDASCTATAKNGLLEVTPRPWVPPWSSDGSSPDTAAASGKRRQFPQTVAGDPRLSEISGGNETYRTAGQREAVRTICGARSGSSNVVVLPTGSGKTTAFIGPAFLARPKLSVLIVPTVSLARDLERRFQEDFNIGVKVAYHGGLSQPEKDAFRERMRSGDQWVVVTSPEAACTALSSDLQKIAQQGKLRYFGIDEAHMVASWGGAFRPEFQALAGLRRRLADASRSAGQEVTTVLLTGTLDEHGLETLETLFSDCQINLVAAQATRPEPAYWVATCEDDEQKRLKVLDALYHLPRPLIIYTSLVEATSAVNVQDVKRWLHQAGFKRFGVVAGKSRGSTMGQEVVAAIRCMGEPAADLDVVVASSAFGLGVDIPNVRTVVHACIPESLDRFYQEVGRGGRDGNASISLLVHSPSDVDVAKGLAEPGDLGPDLGWKRWQAMDAGSQPSGEFKSVALTAAHETIRRPSGEMNRHWNLHTLATMERAGMIRLDWSLPAQIGEDFSEEEVALAYEQARDRIDIEIIQGDLRDQRTFKKRYRAMKDQNRAGAIASHQTVLRLTDDRETCPNRALSLAYRLRRPNDDIAHVDWQCGGCASCGYEVNALAMAESVPYVHTPDMAPASGPIRDLAGGSARCSITYLQEPGLPWSDIGTLLGRLCLNGLERLVLPKRADLERVDIGTGWLAVDGFSTWFDQSTSTLPALTTAVVLPTPTPTDAVRALMAQAESHQGVLIAVFHQQTAMPHPSKHLLYERLGRSLTLEKALREI